MCWTDWVQSKKRTHIYIFVVSLILPFIWVKQYNEKVHSRHNLTAAYTTNSLHRLPTVADDCCVFVVLFLHYFCYFGGMMKNANEPQSKETERCARKRVWREKRVCNLKGQGCISSQSVFESSHLMIFFFFLHIDVFWLKCQPVCIAFGFAPTKRARLCLIYVSSDLCLVIWSCLMGLIANFMWQ